MGTKWILKNKQDDNEVIVRNKTRLVAQGYSQIEMIDYEGAFTLLGQNQLGYFWP